MMPNTVRIGKIAEERAVVFLQQKGFEILARNVRYKMAEIDIIAKDKGILCFVEVRSRSDSRFGAPQESVNVAKQRKIIQAAQNYLRLNYKGRLPICRFDVVAVTGQGNHLKILHLPNAFWVEEKPHRRGF